MFTTITSPVRDYVAMPDVLVDLNITGADRATVESLVGQAGGVRVYAVKSGSYFGIERQDGGVVAYLRPGSLTLTTRAGFVPEGAIVSTKEPDAWEVRLSGWREGVAGGGGLRAQALALGAVCPECFMHMGVAETQHEC